MPAKHKYKCLNPFCRLSLFVAMNSPIPSCPECGSIKKDDLGETTFEIGYVQASSIGISGDSSVVRQSDANQRAIADRYGLTDMNNKDGQAVKRRAALPPASGPTTSIGGYQVPIDAAASGASIRLPMTVPMKASINSPNTNSSGMLKGMTNVVAQHKGQA